MGLAELVARMYQSRDA